MSRVVSRHSDFRSGLQNTAPAQQAGAAGFQTAYDCRVDSGPCARRPGKVLVGRLTPTVYCGDFDGVNDVVTTAGNDTRIWPLGLKWSIELLVSADATAGDMYVIGSTGVVYGVRVKQTAAATIVVDVQDSASTVVSLTSAASAIAGRTTAILLTRNGATLSLYVNNAAAVTGTMAAALSLRAQTLTIGAHAGANFYDGKIDFVRGRTSVKTTQQDGYQRSLNPWARDVLFDYCLQADAAGDVQDRSAFGNHATNSGATLNTTQSLAVNPATIQAICGSTNAQTARQIVVVAGGRQFEGSIS